MHPNSKKRKHDMMGRMERRIKHLKKSQTAELIGWIGSVSILSSYGLLSMGIIDGASPIYHMLVLFGSIGLALITYRHRAFQSFTVNIAFGFFAILALIRIFLF